MVLLLQLLLLFLLLVVMFLLLSQTTVLVSFSTPSPVQLWVVQQLLLRVVLLEKRVGDDRDARVQGVEEEEEEGVEEGLPAPVGKHGEEELAGHARHVLVEGVLHQERQSAVVPE